jgi:hypothetical protein
MPYEWLHEAPSISHRHTPENLRDEAGADLPAKIVFIECGASWLKEVQWIEQLAANFQLGPLPRDLHSAMEKIARDLA